MELCADWCFEFRFPLVTRANMDSLNDNDVQAIDQLRDMYGRLRKELERVIVGQQNTIERLAICLFARGHALLMGVPGLAKTLLVRKWLKPCR